MTSKIRYWLIGKKTYLFAGLLLLVILGTIAAGKMTPATALTILCLAACGFPVTFRAALEHHQTETLTLLCQIAETGAAVAAKNVPAAVTLGEEAGATGLHLVEEIRSETPGENQ